MSGRSGNARVVKLSDARGELRIPRKGRHDRIGQKVPRDWDLPISWSALWLLVFYAALTGCTALWWHWDEVGLPRLFMGTLLLGVVLLAIGREMVWTHPVWILALPAVLVVAAFFWYPLAPTAVVLALVFIVNVMWFG